MRPNSLAVLGLGAIGGSIAWQARKAGIASVVGYAPDRADSVQALRSAAVHDIADSPARAVRDADLVVLAAPPQAILDLLPIIAPHLAHGALVTDVASIKLPVVTRAVELGLGPRFAGSHPFTGTHIAGWAGARPDRFTGTIVYVCQAGPEGEGAAREVMHFWGDVLGAHPVLVDARAHDGQLAWTSHLPQAVASALGHALAGEPSLRGASWGAGARDTTRLAASPAEMWVDVFLMNREPIAAAIGRAEGALAVLRGLIDRGDRAALYAYLEEAALFRRRLDEASQGERP
jgi:prephenate dehydrogenase